MAPASRACASRPRWPGRWRNPAGQFTVTGPPSIELVYLRRGRDIALPVVPDGIARAEVIGIDQPPRRRVAQKGDRLPRKRADIPCFLIAGMGPRDLAAARPLRGCDHEGPFA